jgi:hypothetical protein
MKSGGNWKIRTNENLSSRSSWIGERIALMICRVEGCGGCWSAGGGGGIGSRCPWSWVSGAQRSMRRRTVRDIGTLSQAAAPAPDARKVEKTRAGGGPGAPPVSASAAVGENWSTMPSHHNLLYSTVLRHQPRTSLKPGFHDSALCCWSCDDIPVHLQVTHFRVLQTGDFEHAALTWRGLILY